MWKTVTFGKMTVVGKVGGTSLLKLGTPVLKHQACPLSFSAFKKSFSNRRLLYTGIGLTGAGLGMLIYTLDQSVAAYDWPLHPQKLAWSHNGYLSALDHASIRRGYEVYRNVCSACHSMKFVPFRRLVDVAYTEQEMKEIASEIMVTDGPDDTGNYFQRPAKLSDYFPNPYPNDEAAAAANNGAVPPDLSAIVLGRHGGEDYIFSLLTGYVDDPPAGVTLEEGANYNPYFQGSIIAMAPPLYNGVIEYSDGTPATLSQMAKDVCTFLVWSSQPEWDMRKLWLIKFNMWGWPVVFILWYLCRHKWSIQKTRKIVRYMGSSAAAQQPRK